MMVRCTCIWQKLAWWVLGAAHNINLIVNQVFLNENQVVSYVTYQTEMMVTGQVYNYMHFAHRSTASWYNEKWVLPYDIKLVENQVFSLFRWSLLVTHYQYQIYWESGVLKHENQVVSYIFDFFGLPSAAVSESERKWRIQLSLWLFFPGNN